MACNKIGIDFHGVINTNPRFFKDFLAVMLEHNIEVHIISGGPRDFLEKYLQQHQIPYSVLWCIFDFYEAKDQVIFNDDGTFFVDDELWNTAKAEYCAENGISLHIDDSLVYERSFSTPYCRYDAKKQECTISGKVISFSGNPREVWAEIVNCGVFF